MRKPSLKPGALSREELQEQRIADLERATRRMAARDVSGGTQATTHVVQQTSHGLSVGKVIRHNGTSWVNSQADTTANAVVGGVVVAVLSPDVFVLATAGYIGVMIGLTAGTVYYLSSSIAGNITSTPPAIPVPVMLAISSSEAVLTPSFVSAERYSSFDWEYVTTLTSGTSYAIPSGARVMRFVLVAGGGGGGGNRLGVALPAYTAPSSGGSPTQQMHVGAYGGAGGSGAVFALDCNVDGLASVSYSIGAGGAAGTAAPTNGGDGGDTTITVGSDLWTCTRGYGGAAATLAGLGVVGGNGGQGGVPSYSDTGNGRTLALNVWAGRQGMPGGSGLNYTALAAAHSSPASPTTNPPWNRINGSLTSIYGSGGGSQAAGEPGVIYVFRMI